MNLLNDPNIFNLSGTQTALLNFLDAAPDAGLGAYPLA